MSSGKIESSDHVSVMPAGRRRILLCLLIAILSLAAYWPATRAEFVGWDDYSVVRDNPVLRSPSWQGLAERWTKPYLAMYMPLTQTFYQIVAPLAQVPGQIGISELNPWVFHWAVIVIRLLTIPVIFAFLTRIVADDFAAAVRTALLMLHPITVEAVAWVSEASMPLAMLLTAGCLWQWLIFRQSPRHRKTHVVLATVFYILALLAKPACVCIPLMAWALDVWVVKLNWKKSLLQVIPWIVLAIPLAWYTHGLQTAVKYGVWVPPWWKRPAVAIDAIVFYLGKILVPRNLGMDYGRTPRWILHQHGILILDAVAIVLLLAAFWLLRKRRPKWIAAAVIFIAGMLPVMGLTPFAFQTFSTVADRYAYLPMLGVAIFVATLLAGVRQIWPWVLSIAVLLCCAILTFNQAKVWQNNYSLYSQALKVNPNSWVAWDNLAFTLIGDNQPARALVLAEHSWSLSPEHSDVAINIGIALGQLGRPAQAVPYLQRAIRNDPDDSITAMNLGSAYVKLGYYRLGVKWLEYSLKLNPASIKVPPLLAGAIQLRDYYEHQTTRPARNPAGPSVEEH